LQWKGPGSPWEIGMDQINCECIYSFDSIYYIVQLIFNFFRFLITCGYDTIHNKKIVYVLYLFMSTGKQRLYSHKQFFTVIEFFLLLIQITIYSICIFATPFSCLSFFFLYQTSNVEIENIFSLFKTNKINFSFNWMSNTYAEFDIW